MTDRFLIEQVDFFSSPKRKCFPTLLGLIHTYFDHLILLCSQSQRGLKLHFLWCSHFFKATAQLQKRHQVQKYQKLP